MADAAMEEVEVEAPAEGNEELSAFSEIQMALAAETGEAIGNAMETAEEFAESDLAADFSDDAIDSAALEEQAPPKKEKGSRAQKRIQSLNQKNKELAEQMAQRDAYYQQQLAMMQQQMQQGQQESERSAQQEQLELQRRQLEILQRQREREDESNLSPMEAYRRQILKDAEGSMKSAVSSELEELRRELNAEKDARAQQREEVERQQRYAYYQAQTRQATNKVLLDGFSDDHRSSLGKEADEMILAYAGAFGVEPKDAAVRFKKWMDGYVQASLSGRAQKGGRKIQKSRQVPSSSRGGKRAVKGNAYPEFKSLRKAGYDSYVEWVAAGEPPIS